MAYAKTLRTFMHNLKDYATQLSTCVIIRNDFIEVFSWDSVSKQEDDLDARGESGLSPKGRVSHKKQESLQRTLEWVCDEKDNWLLLKSLPLNVERMDCYAVYLIWYIDQTDLLKTVRVGIKSPEDPLLFILPQDPIH